MRCGTPSDLHKSFGSLVVAQDVSITLPQGARHALIGPNGAGKTTLINLITGVLDPDPGMYCWVTRTSPHCTGSRVKRGLVRTFQINTLFPGLEPLEAVTLAVCERKLGVANNWWRGLGAFRAEIDEAYAILESLRLRRGVPTASTRELAYGQQRLLEIALALATKPKVLLLDEPAAGVPRQDSRELFDAIADLPGDISVLFIEHDMELVFRFASRVIVMVGGRLLLEGTPAEIAAERASARSVPGTQPAWLKPLLALDEVRAGYGESIVLDGVSMAVVGRRQPCRARAQRCRQIDLAADDNGIYPAGRGQPALARPRHRSRLAVSTGAIGHRLVRAGA